MANACSSRIVAAADLSVIATVSTGPSIVTDALGLPCSDGINFWIGLHGDLLRF
jgi:hypothetical protein